MKKNLYWIILFVLNIILIFMLVFTTKAENMNNILDNKILFIGSLDYDNYLDTIYSKKMGNKFIPGFIVLGRNRLDSILNCDSITNQNSIEIIYPELLNMRVNYSIDKFNNDSLFDIALFYSGIEKDSLGNNIEIKKKLVIFGQDLFSSLNQIELNKLTFTPNDSIISNEFKYGENLIEGKYRDLNLNKSYILNKFNNVQILPKLSPLQDYLIMIKDDYESSITPNPVSDILNLELTTSIKDKYLIELYSITGIRLIQQTFDLNENSKNILIFRISSFANGIYFLKISNRNNLIKSHKIVIFH